MSLNSFQISHEELSVAMTLLGKSDEARGYLQSSSSLKSPEDLESRLIAASHSLIARDLIEVSNDSGAILNARLKKLVQALLDNRFFIRCSKTVPGGQVFQNYFVNQEGVVLHKHANIVVSCLEEIPDVGTAAKYSYQFLGFPQNAFVSDAPSGSINTALLQNLNGMAVTSSKESIASQLENEGLLPEVAQRLADDFKSSEFKGSVLKAITNSDGQPVSKQGFLFLKAPERFWLFEFVSEEPPLSRVFEGSFQQYNRLFQSLFDSPNKDG